MNRIPAVGDYVKFVPPGSEYESLRNNLDGKIGIIQNTVRFGDGFSTARVKFKDAGVFILSTQNLQVLTKSELMEYFDIQETWWKVGLFNEGDTVLIIGPDIQGSNRLKSNLGIVKNLDCENGQRVYTVALCRHDRHSHGEPVFPEASLKPIGADTYLTPGVTVRITKSPWVSIRGRIATVIERSSSGYFVYVDGVGKEYVEETDIEPVTDAVIPPFATREVSDDQSKIIPNTLHRFAPGDKVCVYDTTEACGVGVVKDYLSDESPVCCVEIDGVGEVFASQDNIEPAKSEDPFRYGLFLRSLPTLDSLVDENASSNFYRFEDQILSLTKNALRARDELQNILSAFGFVKKDGNGVSRLTQQFADVSVLQEKFPKFLDKYHTPFVFDIEDMVAPDTVLPGSFYLYKSDHRQLYFDARFLLHRPENIPQERFNEILVGTAKFFKATTRSGRDEAMTLFYPALCHALGKETDMLWEFITIPLDSGEEYILCYAKKDWTDEALDALKWHCRHGKFKM